MNLSSRVSRMEAQHGSGNTPVVIVAEDQEDFRQQFEDVLLASRPGLLPVSGTVAGEPFKENINVLPHEDTLELLL